MTEERGYGVSFHVELSRKQSQRVHVPTWRMARMGLEVVPVSLLWGLRMYCAGAWALWDGLRASKVYRGCFCSGLVKRGVLNELLPNLQRQSQLKSETQQDFEECSTVQSVDRGFTKQASFNPEGLPENSKSVVGFQTNPNPHRFPGVTT